MKNWSNSRISVVRVICYKTYPQMVIKTIMTTYEDRLQVKRLRSQKLKSNFRAGYATPNTVKQS